MQITTTHTMTNQAELDALIASAEEDKGPQPSPSPPPAIDEPVKRTLLAPSFAFRPLLPGSYLPPLNENQRKAVEHSPDGGLQILAGPGSGRSSPLVV